MRIIIKTDHDDASEWVSEYILQKINNHNESRPFVLGLPTGNSPLKIYKNLINYYKEKKLSFANVITFNMDEYVGLSENDSESYAYYMKTNFFEHIDIPKENINLLNGCASDLNSECIRYENKIKEVGGIDIFLGGIGRDGHIAFNEPGSSLSSRTRIKTLCGLTLTDNSKYFNDISHIPTTALTVGIKTILEAREIIIIINGRNKALPLSKCIEEGVNHMWPLSVLQNHERVIIACDEASTDELKVKTVNYFKQLQMTTDMMGNSFRNSLTNNINYDDKLLVLSPHPDDDVIGIGGLLQLVPNKKNVRIVYMTSGSGGLRPNYPSNTRQKEAVLALKILGYNETNIIFCDFPFYKDKKEVGIDDVNMLTKLYMDFKPNHVFVCGDEDPNRTHNKCYDVIYRVNSINIIKKEFIFIKKYWIYKGAWGDWKDMKNNIVEINLSKPIFENKKLSIEAHMSQDPPCVTNNDTRTFLQRVIDKNKDCYKEKLLIMTKQEFIKNKILKN